MFESVELEGENWNDPTSVAASIICLHQWIYVLFEWYDDLKEEKA